MTVSCQQAWGWSFSVGPFSLWVIIVVISSKMLIKIAMAESNCFSFILYLSVSSEVDVFKIQKNLLLLQVETGSWGFQLFSPLCTAHKFPSSLSWSATTQSSHHSLNSDYTKDGTQGVPLERLGANCSNQTLPSSVRGWDLSFTSFMHRNYSGWVFQISQIHWRAMESDFVLTWHAEALILISRFPQSDLPKALVLSVCWEEEQRVSCHHTFVHHVLVSISLNKWWKDRTLCSIASGPM